MVDRGEPDTLTVSRIRKKWENLYTKYQVTIVYLKKNYLRTNNLFLECEKV